MRRTVLLCSVTCAWLFGLFSSAWADQSETPQGYELETVIVTAEKKPEPAQTTPVSMGIYTRDDILSKGIADVESLTYNDASLNFNMNAGEPYLTMRGISSSDVSEIGDPAVPVSHDGFFVNRSYGLLTSLYDVDRIEVLRGPQGTLYGRNAIGGVVNIVSSKPINEFETTASIEAGNYNALNFTAMLNLPLSDALQLRAAVSSQNHDGYRTVYPGNGLGAQRGDDEDVRSGRLEVAFSPVESLHALLTIESTQVGGVGEVVKEVPFVPSTTIPGDIAHVLPNVGDSNSWDTFDPTSLAIDEKTYKWQLSYDALPGGAQVTYLGGYDNLEFHHDTPSPGILGDPPASPVIISYNEYPKTQNHELRVASAPSGVFTWQAGVFYFEERNTNLDTFVLENQGTSASSQAIAFRFPLVESTSRALFGQGSVNLSNTVKITAGARYTSDSKERTGVEELPFIGVASIPDGGSGHWSKTTGHVGIDWDATPRNFEYAKVDTGYKAGGFASCNEYQPETVTTFEMGSKNRNETRTVQANIAAFYSDYKNQQVSLNVPTSVCVGGSTEENAGESKIYGLEADVNALIAPVGRLDMSLTYLHARYSSFVVAPGLPAAVADCASSDAVGNCQLRGNTLPQSPTWSAVVGLSHEWHLPDAMLATGRLEEKFQSKQYFDPFNYASTTQAGYALANASLDVGRDRWKVGLWVRNLANRLYFVEAQEQYGFNSYEYGFGAPRTFGVKLTVTTR